MGDDSIEKQKADLEATKKKMAALEDELNKSYDDLFKQDPVIKEWVLKLRNEKRWTFSEHYGADVHTRIELGKYVGDRANLKRFLKGLGLNPSEVSSPITKEQLSIGWNLGHCLVFGENICESDEGPEYEYEEVIFDTKLQDEVYCDDDPKKWIKDYLESHPSIKIVVTHPYGGAGLYKGFEYLFEEAKERKRKTVLAKLRK